MIKRFLILLIVISIVLSQPIAALAQSEDELAPRTGVPAHGWVSGDGHMHTTYSYDATNTVAEMVAAAQAAGLNYVVITDHNNSDAWASGELAALQTGNLVTTIWGQEYTRNDCHATIMSMKPVRNYSSSFGNNDNVVPLSDMMNEVHAMGGLVIAAHPFDTSRPALVPNWETYPWDALEVWNGYYGGRHNSTIKAFQLWDRQNRFNLDSTTSEQTRQRLYGVAQSDMHNTTYFGRTVYTRAYVESLNAENIFNAYRKGNIYGTNGPTMSFTVNGQIMGGDVVLDPDDFDQIGTDRPWTARSDTTKVNVRIGGSYSKGLSRAILIHNKHRDGFSGFIGEDGQRSYSYSTVFNLGGATSFEREFTVEVAAGDFLRLELEGSDGNTLAAYNQETTGYAFSNPIFITDNSRTTAEFTELLNEANTLRSTRTASYAYTTSALSGLDKAITDAISMRAQMGAAAANRPSVSQINSSYNMLLKAIDDFKLQPQVPKTPGWQQVGGNVYYVSTALTLTTGIQSIAASKYYFSEQTGAAILHWQRMADGTWYFFENTGNPPEKGKAYEGFRTISGKTYHFRPFPDNSMSVGMQIINGYRHYFNATGAMQTGWVKADTAVPSWYYFQPSTGQGVTGWFSDRGSNYYLDPGTGLTLIGMQVIEGKRYFFNASGQQLMSGWQTEGGATYYIDNGVCVTGWLSTGGKWYYFDAAGRMQTGWQKINGRWYYLNTDGAMRIGWLEEKVSGKASKWYYLNSNGAMAVGWTPVNGRWYYMHSSGLMATGWVKVNGVWYFMYDSGAMKTGWHQEGTKWYYLSNSGAMVTGTVRIGNKTYNFNGSGLWIP